MRNDISRREFIVKTGAALAVGMLPAAAYAKRPANDASIAKTGFPRMPDSISAITESGEIKLSANGNGAWEAVGVAVLTTSGTESLDVRLASQKTPVKRIALKWRDDFSGIRQMLGDHWERSYGDLHWSGPDSGRVMPWYTLAFDGEKTDGYGVRTGPGAFCHWTISPNTLTLMCDVRSGGKGVLSGDRIIDVCSVIHRPGKSSETPHQAAREFCAMMCPSPRLVPYTVFGSNDWYYSYGMMNTAANIAKDAQFISSLSPDGPNRPFTVVDAGWQPQGGCNGGPWDRGGMQYGSMAKLADSIRKANVRPGIWVRPLAAAKDQPDTWRLSRDKGFLDPTIPDVLQQITADIARFREWGYELVKHDFTTYDITGKWGRVMGGDITGDGWGFSIRNKTTAEIILDLYRTIRQAAGDALIIGCNTVSHLSAGLFEIYRTGDDTSGKEWAGTLKNGVNTLAFRSPQHNTFYAADADCIGLVKAGLIPWEKNRQWLDLLARSGTPVFISLNRKEIGDTEKNDIREALALTTTPKPAPEPLDWMQTELPRKWKLMGEIRTYDW